MNNLFTIRSRPSKAACGFTLLATLVAPTMAPARSFSGTPFSPIAVCWAAGAGQKPTLQASTVTPDLGNNEDVPVKEVRPLTFEARTNPRDFYSLGDVTAAQRDLPPDEIANLDGTLAYISSFVRPEENHFPDQDLTFRVNANGPSGKSQLFTIAGGWSDFGLHYSDNGRYLFFMDGWYNWGRVLYRVDLASGKVTSAREFQYRRVFLSADGRFVAMIIDSNDEGEAGRGGHPRVLVYDFEQERSYIVAHGDWFQFHEESLNEMAWTARDSLLYLDAPPVKPGGRPTEARAADATEAPNANEVNPSLWEWDSSSHKSAPVASAAYLPVAGPDPRWVVVNSDDNINAPVPPVGTVARKWPDPANRTGTWLWDRKTNHFFFLTASPHYQAKWAPDGKTLFLLNYGPVSGEVSALDMSVFEGAVDRNVLPEGIERKLATIPFVDKVGGPLDPAFEFVTLLRADSDTLFVETSDTLSLIPRQQDTSRNVFGVDLVSGKIALAGRVHNLRGDMDFMPASIAPRAMPNLSLPTASTLKPK